MSSSESWYARATRETATGSWSRQYAPNTVLQDIRPEGNLQPDDEIIIPQDDLYVITWETNFGEFPNSDREVTFPERPEAPDISNSLEDDTNHQGELFTDVDFRSNGPHENENFDPNAKAQSQRMHDQLDDQQLSGGSDTIVREVSEDENDDMFVDNESPKERKYNFRPTPNFCDENRY